MQSLKHNAWKFSHKLLNAIGKIPGLRLPMNSRALQALRLAVFNRYVIGMPDRRYLDDVIMPALGKAGTKRVLFVGCASYTRHNHAAFEAQGIECWTTDILPENAKWGHPQRHIIGDIAAIRGQVPAEHFDAVLFNGVMGYGVTGADMVAITPALHAILRPSGMLLIGWNRGLVEDPCALACVNRHFTHGNGMSLPDRNVIPDSTHVFDWFIKTAYPVAP